VAVLDAGKGDSEGSADGTGAAVMWRQTPSDEDTHGNSRTATATLRSKRLSEVQLQQSKWSNSMKIYWDHSEKERSELTREQVEDLLKFELMREGVLKPEAPEYLPETVPAVQKRTLYRAKLDYSTCDMVFDSADKCAQAIALSCGFSSSHYLSGLSLSGYKSGTMTIDPVEVCDEADVAAQRSALEQIGANKKSNETKRAAFNKAVKECEKTTQGVWDDWLEQRDKARTYQKIIATFNEYAVMSDGKLDIAYTFLCKAFSADEVQKAGEWCGDVFLATPRDEPAVEAPAADEPELVDAI
jgi:hypothetical protein